MQGEALEGFRRGAAAPPKSPSGYSEQHGLRGVGEAGGYWQTSGLDQGGGSGHGDSRYGAQTFCRWDQPDQSMA